MKWTTDKPTKSGLFQFKRPRGIRTVVSVESFAGDLVVFWTGVSSPIALRDIPVDARWAGPIEEPTP